MIKKFVTMTILTSSLMVAQADSLYHRPWYTRILSGNSFLKPIKPVNLGITSNLNVYQGDFLFDERHENPERNQVCITGQRCSKADPTLGFGAFAEANLKLFSYDFDGEEANFTIGVEIGSNRLFYGGLKGWTKEFSSKYECDSYIRTNYVRTSCGWKTISNKFPVYKNRVDADTYRMVKVGMTAMDDLMENGEIGEGFFYLFVSDRDFKSNGYGGTKEPNREIGIGADYYQDNSSVRFQWAAWAPDTKYKGRLTMEIRVNF